ncbi:NAD-binding protein [Paraburkholderia sp. 1N]|uniref:NAD-binding protein n=2 Tax=Paraburkholderia solitsugae TaxID=2675748 RepID=A0ABX2BV79_9BURK|nr:NAD-binding protein [Paraburkholderia solitsugae]
MEQINTRGKISPRVGMIGLGMMGGAIARNILKRGFTLSVVGHRSRNTIEGLVAQGAYEVDTGSELARNSDVVLICVTGTHQVRDILWGANGVLEGAHAGLVVVDASTSDPILADEAIAELLPKGAQFLDAPVNRTPKEAEEGRLNVLVGGDACALAIVRPVMEAYSETIHHLGPGGSGYKAKLIHNFIAQANATVLAEAMCTAAKVGLDLNEFVRLCRLSGAHSRTFDRIVPFIVTGDDSGQRFALRNAAKDMWSYSQLAATAQTTAVVAEAVRQTYVLATNLGYGDKHVPHLFDALGHINGVSVRAPQAAAQQFSD